MFLVKLLLIDFLPVSLVVLLNYPEVLTQAYLLRFILEPIVLLRCLDPSPGLFPLFSHLLVFEIICDSAIFGESSKVCFASL